MKNIGIIVDNEFNSDIRVRKEIEILKKNGFGIYVLCFAFDNKSYPDVDGVKITRIQIKRSTKNALFFLLNRLPFYELLWKKEVAKFIRENAIDIVHVHDLYMSKSVHLGIKSAKKEIPLILDLHENFPHAIQSYNWTAGPLRNFIVRPKLWLKKEAEYLSYASKLIVLSESFKQDLLNRYAFLNAQDITPFPNVIDLTQFEKYAVDPKVERSKKVTLTYFGGVAERRGIFQTIEVIKRGLEKNLNIELMIIGPLDKADKKRFLDEINNPKLKESIRYIPWIDISELVTYMDISDILLSPLVKNEQHESGVANKIFQYMYAGKPIIVSDCKPQKDLIERFNCGLSYSTEEEYLDCITTLAESQELREKLGANGFKKLYEEYDNQEYENILVNLYDEDTLGIRNLR